MSSMDIYRAKLSGEVVDPEDLPEADASMAEAVFRFEANASAIRHSFDQRAGRGGPTPEAYSHFRNEAFALLRHYVDDDYSRAFEWSLKMRQAAPKKTRISLEGNPFHWGLLALNAAAGAFLSLNKLRDLGVLMWLAHRQHKTAREFEQFIGTQRASALDEARMAIAELSMKTNDMPTIARRKSRRRRTARRR